MDCDQLSDFSNLGRDQLFVLVLGPRVFQFDFSLDLLVLFVELDML